ncbi:MAG: hypothetical protein U0V74_04305 [Chitinophagales bacterium]
MTDYELNVLFGAVEEIRLDNRYADLIKLLPDVEKQMKRKGMTRKRRGAICDTIYSGRLSNNRVLQSLQALYAQFQPGNAYGA